MGADCDPNALPDPRIWRINACRSSLALAFPSLPLFHSFHAKKNPQEDGYDADGRFPKPGRDPSSKYFPTSRCIDFYATRADRHMLQLWRTLLLSCFTVSGTSPEARNATLFPYINYIANLDARTLVMVLTEIMRSQRTGSKSSALGKGAAQYFFEGLLGGLEVSGASRGDKRGDRMIVGGAEYGWASPIYGKEVKVFVGDTALMIMDCLCPFGKSWMEIGFTNRPLGYSLIPSHTPPQRFHDPRARPAASPRTNPDVPPHVDDIFPPKHLAASDLFRLDGMRGARKSHRLNPANIDIS